MDFDAVALQSKMIICTASEILLTSQLERNLMTDIQIIWTGVIYVR